MAYERPKNRLPLSPKEKSLLLQEYVKFYGDLYSKNTKSLNAKLPMGVFSDLLNELGEMLLAKSKGLAFTDGPVGTFLDQNPLPPAIEQRLPREYRVFCLALNAIKQWVAAEQSATDRYLLGGKSRELCRAAAKTCVVTGDSLASGCELHHPVRDGRPAIPLSKRGHGSIEGQLLAEGDDPFGQALFELRGKGNRSWAQLRLGCLDLLGQLAPVSAKRGSANARSFAKKAVVDTGRGYEEILEWLDKKKLGK